MIATVAHKTISTIIMFAHLQGRASHGGNEAEIVVIAISGTMLPLICLSLCAHKSSFVQHFTRTRLYLERRICAKTFLEGTFMCAPRFFFCAFVSRPMCAHAHSLEGALFI